MEMEKEKEMEKDSIYFNFQFHFVVLNFLHEGFHFVLAFVRTFVEDFPMLHIRLKSLRWSSMRSVLHNSGNPKTQNPKIMR